MFLSLFFEFIYITVNYDYILFQWIAREAYLSLEFASMTTNTHTALKSGLTTHWVLILLSPNDSGVARALCTVKKY